MKTFLTILALAFSVTSGWCDESGYSLKDSPVIVISTQAEDQESFAADDLKKYLDRITGSSFVITTEPPQDGRGIFLGEVEANADLRQIVRDRDLGRDGFVVDISSRGVRILGGSKFGTSYGAYEFLERLGVRWLFPGEWGEVVPEKREITLSEQQIIDKPVFAIRQFHSAWVREEAGEWYRRNRHNRSGFFGHSGLINPKQYGAQHPEWYAEIDGRRRVDDPNFKLCHSNQAMVAQAVADTLKDIRQREANGDPIEHIGYRHLTKDYSLISISPTDGGAFCQCQGCLKMGSLSDRLQIFANTIAAEVRKEFPQYSVGYYGAYSEAQDPPTVKADPGVIAFTTTWTRNFFKPLSDSSNTAYRTKLDEFSQTCPEIVMRDFDGLTVWWGFGPMTLADVHAEDYQWYHKHGIQGVVTEAHTGWGPWGYSYYLTSKLWWNPYADLEALKKDFIVSAYDKAAEPMTEYYKILDQSKVHPSPKSLYKMRQYLEAAAKMENSPGAKKRIDYLRAHYLLWDISVRHQAGEARPDDISLFYSVLKSIDSHVSSFSRNRRFFRSFPSEPEGVRTLTEIELAKALDQVDLKEPAESFAAWMDQDDLRLVPLLEDDTETKPGLGMSLRYGPTKILIRARKGERIFITQNSQRGVFDTSFEMKDPDLVTLDEGVAKAAGVILDRLAPADGIYTLTLSPGGYYPEIEVSNRYAVVKASDVSQRAHPMGKVKETFFFVPKGTKEFAISAKAYEPLTLKIKGPVDNPLSIPDITQKSQIYQEHRISVPEGTDGQVWRMEMNGGKKDIFLSGIPPFFASEPERLLVPPDLKVP